MFIVLLLLLIILGTQDTNYLDFIPQWNKNLITFTNYIPWNNGLLSIKIQRNNTFDTWINNNNSSLLIELDEVDKILYNYIVFDQNPVGNSEPTGLMSLWEGPSDGSASEKLWKNYPDWHKNEVVFSNMCIELNSACKAFSNIAFTTTYLNKSLLKMILSTFRSIFKAMNDWQFKACTFPWGRNWYEFVISSPMYMIFSIHHLYTVGKKIRNEIKELKAGYVKYIDKLFVSPVKAIGWSRTGSNIILQGAPFCVARHWAGDLDKIKDTKDMKTMVEQCNITMVLKGEGLRPDYGWIFHTNVRAYGYLSSSINSANIINILGFVNNYGDIYERVSKIQCHPIVDANLPGLFSRAQKVKRYMGVGDFGIQYQFSDSIVNVKFKKYFMQFFGQDDLNAYYESDKQNNAYLPLWAFLREMWIVNDYIRQYDSDSVWKSPGCVVWNKKPFLLPTKTTTTTSFKSSSASSGFIYALDVNIFYNYYTIDDTYFFLNKGHVQEFQIFNEKYKRSIYIVITQKEEDISIIAEVGIVKKKINDKKYLFTNGKVLTIITGDLTIEDQEYTCTNPFDSSEITETHSVFRLTTKPTTGKNDTTNQNFNYYFFQFHVGFVVDENPDSLELLEYKNYNLNDYNKVLLYNLALKWNDLYIQAFINNIQRTSALWVYDVKNGKASAVPLDKNMDPFKVLSLGQPSLPNSFEISPIFNEYNGKHYKKQFAVNDTNFLYYYTGNYNFTQQFSLTKLNDKISFNQDDMITIMPDKNIPGSWSGDDIDITFSSKDDILEYNKKHNKNIDAVMAADWEDFEINKPTLLGSEYEIKKIYAFPSNFNSDILQIFYNDYIYYTTLDETILYDNKILKPYVVIKNPPADFEGLFPPNTSRVIAIIDEEITPNILTWEQFSQYLQGDFKKSKRENPDKNNPNPKKQKLNNS